MAAAAEAANVLAATGKSFVLSKLSNMVNTPVLAAVSPKRESGPWTKAGNTPR
eukprot:CAMPEP_0170836774 /NCGR_PEP_ID=MMETSP0734-20130129/2369_1 /TAXON_ID=186038 /ORGANISM="Fragilariopsis kerguelensis, Strain L26-C5" /LENGTH=52 /DNA_ID=CAMNT_0011203829 /DNA_START=473 /DNA_END=631 /DNA_ORIENTATION=+